MVRHVLPAVITLAALVYVFGYATDWRRLLEATRQADIPLFVALTALDKLVFFFVWALLQAEAIRRFVAPVSRRSILAVRGGSELFRAVSNPLADAGFLLGVSQLTAGRLDAVIVVALIPFVTHLIVLLGQITLALPFLEGGLEANGGVVLTAGLGWTLVGTAGLALRFAPVARLPGIARLVDWMERIPLRRLAPFFAVFVALAIFDVFIQGMATRAFGVPVPWVALAARIPVLYLALSVPSVGSFGVREFAWAGLFAEFGDQDALFAFAFATNSIFLILNVLIGACFLPWALRMVAEIRRARRRGDPIPEPLLHDALDP